MNTLRQRMINDLHRAGLSPRSQKIYLNVVDKLASRSWRSLEDLSEQEVHDYLLAIRDDGAARGTFKTSWFGIRFFYYHVLDRDWSLFGKKRFANPARSACLMSSPMNRCNTC